MADWDNDGSPWDIVATPVEPPEVMRYAERYPAIPLRSVARCLSEAHREAAVLADHGERAILTARLASARLEEISLLYPHNG